MTHHDVGLNGVIGWPVCDQELHSLELDASGRWSDILLPHVVAH